MQGATRRLKAWLIVALLEAFRYTAQETEAAVPRKRNGGFDVAQSLSFGQEKGNINGIGRGFAMGLGLFEEAEVAVSEAASGGGECGCVAQQSKCGVYHEGEAKPSQGPPP